MATMTERSKLAIAIALGLIVVLLWAWLLLGPIVTYGR